MKWKDEDFLVGNLYYDKQGHIIEDMVEWGMLFGDRSYKIIAQENVGDYFVSTVWLGLDHSHDPNGPPLIFETMIFDNPGDDLYCERYSTLEQAEEGHKIAVRLAKKWLKEKTQ